MIGYPAGIITGITYGLNPLFAVPLMNSGASIGSILFFRYGIAIVILGLFILLRKHSFKVSCKQAGVLIILGLLYSTSSLLLFEAYNYIASGLATTLVFLYPVLVAIINSGSAQDVNPTGILLSVGSSFSYALFIVVINRSKVIAGISNSLLTFYALLMGVVVFFVKILWSGSALTQGIYGPISWLNLVGLALLPTIVSTATLAVATRNIGATKASVLGVFEPITAILVGTLVFGEALTPNIVVGIAIATAAVTFMVAVTKR